MAPGVIALTEATENHQVAAGVSGRKRVVIAMYLHSTNGAIASFHQGGASISGGIVLPANVTVVIQPCDDGWFETGAGNALFLNVTNDVAGLVRYQTIL